MKLHTRRQGSGYSFRLRLSNAYVDAGATYDTEEDAAFAADLAKFYLRTFFYVVKNTEPSLDGEVFSMLAYRANVELLNRCSVEASLSPGVKSFLLTHRDALDANAESNRPERKPWEVLRADPSFTSNPAIREWVIACELAAQDAKDFSEIDSRSFVTRLEVMRNAMQTAIRSLGVAQRMHEGVVNAKLVGRLSKLTELQTNLKATAEYVEFLAKSLAEEQLGIAEHMAKLEANRPPLV